MPSTDGYFVPEHAWAAFKIKTDAGSHQFKLKLS